MRLSYLACGKLLAPHGVRGAIKAESYCDTPAVAAALTALYLKEGSSFRKIAVLSSSLFKQGILVTLEGITTPEEARALCGLTVYARREELDPTGEKVFYAEQEGLPLLDIDTKERYGVIREVDLSRATPLYVVVRESGEEVLFPAVKEFVKEVDVEQGVFVRPIPGFFDEV